MTRGAIVTGGIRGLGAAISRAPLSEGCQVVAVYHGNDAAARGFEAATAIPIRKWDVANFDVCKV